MSADSADSSLSQNGPRMCGVRTYNAIARPARPVGKKGGRAATIMMRFQVVYMKYGGTVIRPYHYQRLARFMRSIRGHRSCM